MFSGVIAAKGCSAPAPRGSWLPARFRRCGRIKLRFSCPLVGRFACLFLLLLGRSPHSITQRWVRRVVEAFPELDGLRHNSRFGGHSCAALFLPSITAMPDRPVMSLPLTHPRLVSRVAAAARRLG